MANNWLAICLLTSLLNRLFICDSIPYVIQSKFVNIDTIDNVSHNRLLGLLEYRSHSSNEPSPLNSSTPSISVDMVSPHHSPITEAWISTHPVEYLKKNDWSFSMDGHNLIASLSFEANDTHIDTIVEAHYHYLFNELFNMGYPHLLRVWNYIPDINAPNDLHGERYKSFCFGRSQAFSRYFSQNTASIPAATGIGALSGSFSIFAIAQRHDTNHALSIQHLENPHQIPAYQYPKQYGDRPPSFSRATSYINDQTHTIYISGTSSVKGADSIYEGNSIKQTEATFDNLSYLISAENLQSYGLQSGYQLTDIDSIKVYIRHLHDFEVIQNMCREVFSNSAQIMFLHADICRSNLAVEIEGIITQPL